MMSKHEPSGIKCHVQNCSLRKTLSAVKTNDRTAISGNSNSNTSYLSSPVNQRGCYRLIRMRHCRTNFAGQLSIRISNPGITGFGGCLGLSIGFVSFKPGAISSSEAAFS